MRMNINDAEKILNGIEKGVSYLPPRLAAILREHNLPCYTGEQFLKALEDNKRKELIANNPLLPYALILTEKEYGKISELLMDEELSQIVPIIRYQDRTVPADRQFCRFPVSCLCQNVAIGCKGYERLYKTD